MVVSSKPLPRQRPVDPDLAPDRHAVEARQGLVERPGHLDSGPRRGQWLAWTRIHVPGSFDQAVPRVDGGAIRSKVWVNGTLAGERFSRYIHRSPKRLCTL